MDRAGSVVRSIAVIALGMLLGACSYDSVVMVPNYAAQIPDSLQHARSFFVASTPANFFRVLLPATQLTLVLAALLTWRLPRARWWIVAALIGLALADVITFTFHYPRNAILFQRPLAEVPVARLEEAARSWGRGNLVRVALLACAAVCALTGHSRSAPTSSAGAGFASRGETVK
jgi:uncharacterized membrane protein